MVFTAWCTGNWMRPYCSYDVMLLLNYTENCTHTNLFSNDITKENGRQIYGRICIVSVLAVPILDTFVRFFTFICDQLTYKCALLCLRFMLHRVLVLKLNRLLKFWFRSRIWKRPNPQFNGCMFLYRFQEGIIDFRNQWPRKIVSTKK